MRIVAIMVAGLALALAGTASAQAQQRPTLTLNSASMTLRGLHFKPNQRVVLLVSGTKFKKIAVRTDGSGSFRLRMLGFSADPCHGFTVQAFSSLGERATFAQGSAACAQMPDLQPPPLDK
jgi:hypothetical protein